MSIICNIKYKKYGFEGMAEVYVQACKEGYSRSYDSMCKKIHQIRDNKVVVKKKKYKSKPNIEKTKSPEEKVQIDIKYIPKESIKFGPKDKNYYQITAIDEYTRKRVLAVIDEKSIYQTAKFLERLEEEIVFKIKTVQTDNGREFTNSAEEKLTAFELKLKEAKIKYKKTRPYSPWQNGIVERSHRLDSKFYENKRFYSLKALKRAVKKYCSRYNNISRKVLGFKSPNQMLEEFKKVTD